MFRRPAVAQLQEFEHQENFLPFEEACIAEIFAASPSRKFHSTLFNDGFKHPQSKPFSMVRLEILPAFFDGCHMGRRYGFL
jgi:hypothetical protein